MSRPLFFLSNERMYLSIELKSINKIMRMPFLLLYQFKLVYFTDHKCFLYVKENKKLKSKKITKK
jgi:hypothetical protein